MGLAALIYALGEAPALGWGSGQILGSLAAAVALLCGFVVRQVGRSDRLLPLRVVLDRNRGCAMAGLIVNGLSTFGMFLILTCEFQTVMGYSALRAGLALIPFALAGVVGSALLARFRRCDRQLSGRPPQSRRGHGHRPRVHRRHAVGCDHHCRCRRAHCHLRQRQDAIAIARPSDLFLSPQALGNDVENQIGRGHHG